LKKLLWILYYLFTFGFSVLQANISNECKTDIYFGNGVWNKQFSKDCSKSGSADCSRKVLDQLIKREIIKNDPILQAKYGKVKLAYNKGQGWDIDLVETFYQLKKAGQIGEKLFFILVDELIAKRASDIIGEDLKKMRQIIVDAVTRSEQVNVNIMLQKYYNESFNLGHRVLLVSHSQGNLFANRIYDSLNTQNYKNNFANVQVASPASSVHATKGMYVTGFVDPIINPIPGSMKSNADLDFPGGHSFVTAYLASQDTFNAIVKGIGSQLENLDGTFGCQCIKKSSEPISTQSGAIETTLSWTCVNDINMDLSFIGDNVIQDVKDEEGVALEHAYVASQSDIYPGAVYEASATGEKRTESSLKESYLDENPINIYAVIKTPL